jgi:hypothetical protein
VKVDRAMYGLLQSARLWYKELSGYLITHGFNVYASDDCVIVKMMGNGKYIVLLLYVDDILVLLLSELSTDMHWVKSILEDRY